MYSNKSLLGCRYFIKTEKEIDFYRVIGFSNSETVVIKEEKTMKKFKINIDKLTSTFTKLLPDGVICICSLPINKSKLNDVMVTYASMKDISSGNNIPSIICRQNINDIYDMAKKKSRLTVGCCVTPTTIPEGVDYNTFMMCDDVSNEIFVSTYLNDDLDDILECVKTKKFDSNLNDLFEFSIDSLSKYDKEKARKEGCFCGYVNNLKRLLVDNGFMDEYYLANNILKLRFKLSINNGEVNELQRIRLEAICGLPFDSHYIIPYDNDIDFTKIYNNRYLLLKDSVNMLYVFTYTSSDEFDPERINFNLLYNK